MPSPNIAVIGLGYVGLPLALAFSRQYSVTGFDTPQSRMGKLMDGLGRIGQAALCVLVGMAFFAARTLKNEG